MNYFKDLIESGHLNTDNCLEMECLYFCFSAFIVKQFGSGERTMEYTSHQGFKTWYHSMYNQMSYFTFQNDMVEFMDWFSMLLMMKLIMQTRIFYIMCLKTTFMTNALKFILQNMALLEPENWEKAENMLFRLMSIANNNTDWPLHSILVI